jgi:hypothetical protein
MADIENVPTPKAELYGGGAPQLRCLTTEEAKQKYGAQVATA